MISVHRLKKINSCCRVNEETYQNVQPVDIPKTGSLDVQKVKRCYIQKINKLSSNLNVVSCSSILPVLLTQIGYCCQLETSHSNTCQYGLQNWKVNQIYNT